MDILDLQQKEPLVRKRISSFVEKLLQHFKYDIPHDRYKAVVYEEAAHSSASEETAKNYFDAYMYLLSNRKNQLTVEKVKRFLYLLLGFEAERGLCIRLVTKWFEAMPIPPLDGAVKLMMDTFKETAELGEEKQTTSSLMLYNFMLAKAGLPTVHMLRRDFEEYEKLRDEYLDGNEAPLTAFLLNLIEVLPTQERSYYESLVPLSFADVYKQIIKDKEMLLNMGIQSIGIFGSFAKGDPRLDSDIDIWVRFKSDLAQSEKTSNSEAVKAYYFSIFKRFTDITEIGEYVTDSILSVIESYKKVF